MAEYQLSLILIGVVIIALFAGGISLYVSDIADKYNVTSYDNSSLNSITSTYDDIENITNETKAKMEELQNKEGILNTLDAFFTQGYSAVRVTKRSVESLDDIIGVTTDVDNTPGLGTMSSLLRSYFTTIVIIIIFIGILAALIIKSDRI